MNYSGYYKFDTSNGEGIRSSLFVSGCQLHCEGCFNTDTWKYNYGQEYTSSFEDQIISNLSHPYIQGLSVLGGNPTDRRNVGVVTQLCERVKRELPEKDIWLWSGNTILELQSRSDCDRLLELVDVLVDGRFEKDKTDSKLLFRGSSNQKVWVKNSKNFVDLSKNFYKL